LFTLSNSGKIGAKQEQITLCSTLLKIGIIIDRQFAISDENNFKIYPHFFREQIYGIIGFFNIHTWLTKIFKSLLTIKLPK